ncbi:Protein of unknown function [Pyronema omphalodes CBS 100304]|uniref:Uncharacterized protein n=1 Tax=Pyronema omphalodes (strain CBS 100304) TaxID=1076935 RepID=U4LGL0_PYROM|nr:Protein of unknown function [Pyronema omphalodes CBS 100304]
MQIPDSSSCPTVRSSSSLCRVCVLRIPHRLSYAVSQHDGGFLVAAVLVGLPGIIGTLTRGSK